MEARWIFQQRLDSSWHCYLTIGNLVGDERIWRPGTLLQWIIFDPDGFGRVFIGMCPPELFEPRQNGSYELRPGFRLEEVVSPPTTWLAALERRKKKWHGSVALG